MPRAVDDGNQDLFLVSVINCPRPWTSSHALPGRDGSAEAARMGESSVSLSRPLLPSPLYWPFCREPIRGDGMRFFGPNLLAGELLGSPCPWGTRRARESPQTPRVRWSGAVSQISADPDGTRRQASAWFAGTIRLPKVLGG